MELDGGRGLHDPIRIEEFTLYEKNKLQKIGEVDVVKRKRRETGERKRKRGKTILRKKL